MARNIVSLVALLALMIFGSACTVESKPSSKNDQTSSPNEQPTAGSVPAELVGVWSSTGSASSSTVYTLNADGTYHETSGLASDGACSMMTVWDVDGTVTFTSTDVTFDRTSGTMTKETCSTPKSTTAVGPDSNTYLWKLEGGFLYTYGADCDDYTACGRKFEKQ